VNRYSIGMTDRRRFLQALAAAGVSRALPGCAQAPRFARDPFALGVASGYPHPGGVALWTRLVGEIGPAPVPVRWEVAGDEAMRRMHGDGWDRYLARLAAVATGLEPGPDPAAEGLA